MVMCLPCTGFGEILFLHSVVFEWRTWEVAAASTYQCFDAGDDKLSQEALLKVKGPAIVRLSALLCASLRDLVARGGAYVPRSTCIVAKCSAYNRGCCNSARHAGDPKEQGTSASSDANAKNEYENILHVHASDLFLAQFQ